MTSQSEPDTDSLSQVFKEFESETLVMHKRFLEIYTQSEQAEQKFLDDLTSLAAYIDEYEAQMSKKLTYFKQTLSKFNKNLNI